MPQIAIFRLCLSQQFKAMQSTATGVWCKKWSNWTPESDRTSDSDP